MIFIVCTFINGTLIQFDIFSFGFVHNLFIHLFVLRNIIKIWTLNKHRVYSLSYMGLRDIIHCNTWKIILIFRGHIAMIHVFCFLLCDLWNIRTKWENVSFSFYFNDFNVVHDIPQI